MIDQALTDTVTIIEKDSYVVRYADVPAYVYLKESITPGDPTGGGSRPYKLVEELRVILPTYIDIDRINDIIVWRGHDYDIDSAAMWRRQRGQDHHQTIVLKYVEG